MRSAHLSGDVVVARPAAEACSKGRVRIIVGLRVDDAAPGNVLDLRSSASVDAHGIGAGELHEQAKRLRDAYIGYVSDRGREWSSRAWWTASAAERNPFVSQAFHQSTRLGAAVNAIESRPGPWRVVCDDPSLTRALGETLENRGFIVDRSTSVAQKAARAIHEAAELLARRLYFTGKWVYRIAVARLAGARHQPALTEALASGQPLTVVQSWLDRRRFSPEKGALSEFANFADVKRWLVARGHVVVEMPFVLRSVPFGAAARAALAQPAPTLLPEAYITLADVLRVAIRSFSRPQRHQYPPLGGLYCGALFEHDERRDWIHHRRLDIELLDAMVSRWKRSGLLVQHFVSTFEAHTWERVIGFALRREYPAARWVGFLSPALSRFRLNEFLTADEWQLAPVPDRVVTYGPTATAHLEAAGCPSERLVTWSAPWLTRLLAERTDADENKEARAVLVLFSVSPAEGRELFDRIERAFRGQSDIEVWLKCHPTLPIGRVRPAGDLPAQFKVIDAPVTEVLSAVPVAVYGSTGTALEVLSSGVVPVHARLAGALDQDPLELWPDDREVADDPASLRNVVLRHLERSAGDRARRRARGVEQLRQYFGSNPNALNEAFNS